MGVSTPPPSPFPRVPARDLFGEEHELPGDLDGDRAIVVVAFHRRHQRDVDSWVPWLEERMAADAGLRFYEVPAIADRWSPVRPLIDGGMARGIGDPVVCRRTLTVYGDIRRLTDPLAIDDRGTVHLFLLDGEGLVRDRAVGPFEPATAQRLAGSLERLAIEEGAAGGHDAPGAPDEVATVTFEFAFDPRFRPLLALAGVTPGHAFVTVTADHLVARFGPWSVETPLTNVTGTCVTRGYHWYKAIGARGSFADLGLTFGTTTRAGVCIEFREPVTGLDPLGLVRHPGLTVTVDDPEGFADLLRRRLHLDPHQDGPPADRP
ncbi:MAG: hypothetical protein R2726_19205 [Acidimicrobiales bacterium]